MISECFELKNIGRPTIELLKVREQLSLTSAVCFLRISIPWRSVLRSWTDWQLLNIRDWWVDFSNRLPQPNCRFECQQVAQRKLILKSLIICQPTLRICRGVVLHYLWSLQLRVTSEIGIRDQIRGTLVCVCAPVRGWWRLLPISGCDILKFGVPSIIELLLGKCRKQFFSCQLSVISYQLPVVSTHQAILL